MKKLDLHRFLDFWERWDNLHPGEHMALLEHASADSGVRQTILDFARNAQAQLGNEAKVGS